MRLMTWRAAARAEQGLPFHRETYLARVLVTEKAMQIGTDGVQLLGGHGFTKEHPGERWYSDLRATAFGHGLHL
jgi:alkylation response protein AidB-like acyl-CoA dehydrogenase